MGASAELWSARALVADALLVEVLDDELLAEASAADEVAVAGFEAGGWGGEVEVLGVGGALAGFGGEGQDAAGGVFAGAQVEYPVGGPAAP